MAQWDHGYVTDVGYTTHFYREMTPAWLAMTSLLLGHRPPDLSAPLRYADLGCGHGMTALVIAATCPQVEVWGFDFNPAHIEFASELAARAGLGNAHFVEAAFADLATQPDMAPSFDVMVSHGVLSWISPANRHHVMTAIGRHLKPGGLAYLSYNVTTGWAAMLPVQALMHRLSNASPERTDLSAPGVLDFLDRLKQAGAGFFTANPVLEQRLQDIRKQDARYIAHEFLNQDWHPLMFAEVAGEMADAKCSYIGSTTLAENIETISSPQGMLPILAEIRDPVLRETLRDFGCAQTFRRDLYRKGTAPMPAAEQQLLLEALSFAGLGQAPPEAGPSFATPIGNVTGRPEVYEPLLALLNAGTVTLAEARESPSLAGRGFPELVQAFTLLVHGGYAHPMLPDAGAAGHAASRRLNQAIALANGIGGDLPRLAAPAIGSSINSDVLETLLVGELLDGKPMEIGPLVSAILAGLARSGRHVQRDGNPVTDPTEARRIVSDAISTTLEKRVPVLRRIGVLQ